MMIDVVGAQHQPRELLQQVVLLVGSAGGADDADGGAAGRVARFAQMAGGGIEGFVPGGGLQMAVLADERLAETVIVLDEVESVAAFDAEEVAVDAALVAVVAANDLKALGRAAHAERSLAAVATMGADGA